MMKNVSKEQADRIFRSCDTSGDDRISLDEFRTMLNKAPNMGGAGKDTKGKDKAFLMSLHPMFQNSINK